MAMVEQPDGVRRIPRGEARPAEEYDLEVDGEVADGFVERLPRGSWRGYYHGDWRTFRRPQGFIQAAQWVADQHRAAKATSDSAHATGAASVRVADPFAGDTFADPLA